MNWILESFYWKIQTFAVPVARSRVAFDTFDRVTVVVPVVVIRQPTRAFVVVAAMGIWFVLVPGRTGWRQWRTHLPLVPFVALVTVYYVLRTRFLTEPSLEPRAIWDERIRMRSANFFSA